MTRRTLTATVLLPGALAALLLAPGLASARSAPGSTDEARRQAAAAVERSVTPAPAPTGPTASTDLARAAVAATPQARLAVRAVIPAGPIQSTDEARALAAAHADGTMVTVASAVAR
jgi:hypothetical protein